MFGVRRIALVLGGGSNPVASEAPNRSVLPGGGNNIRLDQLEGKKTGVENGGNRTGDPPLGEGQDPVGC